MLTEMARKLLSAFHGPAVESSFSTMGEILNSGCSRMDISTYAAIQTIRYSLAAHNTSAVAFFSKRDPVLEAVPKQLTNRIQKSWKTNEDRKEENRQADIDHRVSLGAPVQKPATKKAERQTILQEGQRGREENTSSNSKKQKTPATTESGVANDSFTQQQPENKKVRTEKPDRPIPKKVQKTLACFFNK